MDGFTGFKYAVTEELSGARVVMEPFHVVHLAGDALDECCRRTGQELYHRCGRATDPLYKARIMLHTRSCPLTPRQQHQLADLFASDCHVALEVTWSVYQNIIDAYRDPNKVSGKALMQAKIACLSDAGVPSSLTEIVTLGRTLKRRAGDILAYFDHPHASIGPAEAINGRLEHLRGSGLGIRNLIRYIARAFLEPDGFKTQLHRNFEELNSCECRTRGVAFSGVGRRSWLRSTFACIDQQPRENSVRILLTKFLAWSQGR